MGRVGEWEMGEWEMGEWEMGEWEMGRWGDGESGRVGEKSKTAACSTRLTSVH